jgi:hypothetical protein
MYVGHNCNMYWWGYYKWFVISVLSLLRHHAALHICTYINLNLQKRQIWFFTSKRLTWGQNTTRWHWHLFPVIIIFEDHVSIATRVCKASQLCPGIVSACGVMGREIKSRRGIEWRFLEREKSVTVMHVHTYLFDEKKFPWFPKTQQKE